MPKISELTTAATPTTTDTVPGVQGGSTVKFALLSFFDTLAAFLPSGTNAVYRTITAKLRDHVSVMDFGAVGDGVTDDTTAIQRAANATDTTQILWFPGGTYLVSSLVITPDSHWSFAPGAVLKASLNGNPIIKTRTGASQENLTGNVRRVRLDNPRVDMDGKTGAGILLEGTTHSVVDKPYVYNLASATWSYTDLHGTASYPSTGVMIKGVHGTQGCYYNRVRHGQVTVASGGAATNNCGYWLGTSLTGDDQRANMQTLQECFVSGCEVGIDLNMAGDCRVIQPEVSSNTTGIRVGRTSGTTASRRNQLELVYAEFNTTGVDFTTNARDTKLTGFGSLSGTTTSYTDNGVGTEIQPNNTDIFYLNGDNTQSWLARWYRYGVRFGAVLNGTDKESNVNTLDNYQEGTFTPTIEGGTTAGTGTYTTQNGRYTVIGNRVYFDFLLVWTNTTGTGNLRVGGLPFTVHNNTARSVPSMLSTGLTLTAGNILQGYMNPNDTKIILLQMPTGGGSFSNVPLVGNTSGTIYCSGNYRMY
jgi:hypothetical protein